MIYYDWQSIDCYAGCSACTTSQHQWKRWVLPEGTQLCLVIAGSLQVWIGSQHSWRGVQVYINQTSHVQIPLNFFPVRICVRRTNFSHSWQENRAIPFAATSADTVSPKISLFSGKLGVQDEEDLFPLQAGVFWTMTSRVSTQPMSKQSRPGSQSVLEMSDHVIGISAPGRISDHLWRLHGLFNSTSHLFPIPSTNGNKSPRCSFLALEPSTSWKPFFKSKEVSILFFFGVSVCVCVCVYLKSLETANKKARKKNPVVLCRPWDCEGFPSPHHWSDHPTLAGLAECPPVLLVLVTSIHVSETNLKSTYPKTRA